jgi:hypothetical protein
MVGSRNGHRCPPIESGARELNGQRPLHDPPLERTAAAVYFTRGRASRLRRRSGLSKVLRRHVHARTPNHLPRTHHGSVHRRLYEVASQNDRWNHRGLARIPRPIFTCATLCLAWRRSHGGWGFVFLVPSHHTGWDRHRCRRCESDAQKQSELNSEGSIKGPSGRDRRSEMGLIVADIPVVQFVLGSA